MHGSLVQCRCHAVPRKRSILNADWFSYKAKHCNMSVNTNSSITQTTASQSQSDRAAASVAKTTQMSSYTRFQVHRRDILPRNDIAVFKYHIVVNRRCIFPNVGLERSTITEMPLIVIQSH